jgi:hypothetical protein
MNGTPDGCAGCGHYISAKSVHGPNYGKSLRQMPDLKVYGSGEGDLAAYGGSVGFVKTDYSRLSGYAGHEDLSAFRRIKGFDIPGENGTDNLGTFAPWLKDGISGKSRKNILRIGGTYFLLETPGALPGKDEKKMQEYTGLLSVYGDTPGYTKSFREEFQRFNNADFEEETKKRCDGAIDADEGNKRAMKAAAHGIAMHTAGMAAVAGMRN